MLHKTLYILYFHRMNIDTYNDACQIKFNLIMLAIETFYDGHHFVHHYIASVHPGFCLVLC